MILLDTNILVYIVTDKNKTLVQKIDNIIEKNQNEVYISVVSVAEIKAFAYRNSWGKKREIILNEILENSNVLYVNDLLISDYIEIDVFSQGKHKTISSSFSSKNMGKNDLWIASTAKYFDLTLITTDNDFNHLDPYFINILNLNSDLTC
ncbi:MAG: type II toxin-antitoxin system VapC family toxin [Cyanobacteriota bacterium]